MPLQFGCHNHKVDNSLKPLSAAFAAVRSENPEWPQPIPLPNKYERSTVERGGAVPGVMKGAFDPIFLVSVLLANVNPKGIGIQ